MCQQAATNPADAPPPPLASTPRVLFCLLKKNWILKRRAWKTSLCELFSPALFLSLLVLGYALSRVDYFSSGIYASSMLDLDPVLRAIQPILDGASLNDGASCAAEFASGRNVSAACAAVPDVDLMRLRGSLNSLLNGPLPVLPIDVYLAVGLAVKDSLGTTNYKLLSEFDRYLQLFGNILTPGTLHLCPDGPQVRRFLERSYRRHPTLRNLTVRVHETEERAITSVLDPPQGERTWAVLSFRNLSAHVVDYDIRLNYSTVPNTNLITSYIARGLRTRFQRYTTSGFLTLQSLVDEYAFELAAAEGAAVPYSPPSSYAVAAPMPTAEYSQNLFYVAVSYMLSLVLTMCQLFPVSLLTKSVVVEKEQRLRQTMRIMGLRDRVLYASWWLSAIIQFLLITILCTATIKLFVVHTAAWIVFLYVGLFCLGAISFAFFLSVFFSNAVLSAVVGPIAFFGALLPRYLFFSTNRYERVQSKVRHHDQPAPARIFLPQCSHPSS